MGHNFIIQLLGNKLSKFWKRNPCFQNWFEISIGKRTSKTTNLQYLSLLSFTFYSPHWLGILEIWEYLPITKGLSFSSQFCDTKTLEVFKILKIFIHDKRTRCFFSIFCYKNIGNFFKITNKNSQIYARNTKNPKLFPMFLV
jgi:hypothetical protein